jgi:hypothetical protein
LEAIIRQFKKIHKDKLNTTHRHGTFPDS